MSRTRSLGCGRNVRYNVYAIVDILFQPVKIPIEVITMKMAGVREVRAKSAEYLSGTEPFLVTKHGKVSGVYIPLESPDSLPDDWRREIGKILGLHFARLLESKGL